VNWRPYHTVWTVLLFGWLTNYMIRAGLSPVLPLVMGEFKRTHEQAGALGTVFFTAYVLMQFPAGRLGDLIGRKVILLVGSCGWALASLLTGFAPTFQTLGVCRFLTGLTEGVYFGSDRPVIARVTPPEKMALGQGLSFVGVGAGMFLGTCLGGVIAQAWGWRAVFWLFALPAFLAFLLIAVCIREPAGRGRGPGAGGRRREAGGKGDLPPTTGSLLNRWDLWALYLGGIAGIYAAWVISTWAPKMFQEIGVEDLGRASTYAALYGLAAIPGLLGGGWLSDRLAQRGLGRKMFIALLFLLLAGIMAAFGWGVARSVSPGVLAVLLFLAGLANWATSPAIFSLLAHLVPAEVRGTAFGLMNSVHFLGAILAPWLVGYLRDLTHSFAWGGYSAALLLLLSGPLIASIGPPFRWGAEGSDP